MDNFKKFTLTVLIHIFRIIHVIVRPVSKKVIVFSPADKGSLGDQALMQPIQDDCIKNGLKVQQAIFASFSPLILKGPCLSPLKLTHLSLKSKIIFLFNAALSKKVYLLGADILDGRYFEDQTLCYLDSIDLAARIGVNSRVVGFSFSAAPNPNVVKRIYTLSDKIIFFLRDPNSFSRFRELYPNKGRLVADMAFCVTPDMDNEYAKSALTWISKSKGLVIGINANKLTNRDSPDEVVETYVAFISHTHKKHPNAHFLFIPHDFRRGISNDERTHIEIYKKLKDDCKNQSLLLNEQIQSWNVKALVKHLDILVTGRMHAAIAALGQLTPIIAISYVDKFEGLAEHFELNNELAIIQPEKAYFNNGRCLSDTFEEYLEHLDKEKLKIKKNLPKIQSLSRENLN